MSDFKNRILRAAKLDVHLYEEVEHDHVHGMKQATLVVFLSSLAAGIGSIAYGGLKGIVLGTIIAMAGWYIWAYITYFIGTRFLAEPQTQADHAQLLRTIGFSSAPGMIRVLGIIPGLGRLVFLASSVWMLVAMIIAVRVALDYRSNGRAIAVCAIGWVIQAAILVLLMVLFGAGKGVV